MATIDLNRLITRVPANLLMGYLNSLVTAGVGLATVPAYVSAVGIADYGIIAFFLTCKTVMTAFDIGMTQTVIRETAACLPVGKMGEVRTLFNGFERLTLGLAFLCFLAFTIGAQPIAGHWFHTDGSASDSLAKSILLLGVSLASRWPSGLYQGVLIGAGKMIASSAISITSIAVADIGILLVWYHYTPSIESFFVWQAVIGLIYSVITRSVAFRVLGKISVPTTKSARDYLLRGFTRDLAIISAAGSLLSQFDRLVITSVLSLSDLAIYSMGVMFAASLYMAVNPTFNVMYPRFTQLFVSNAEAELRAEYSRYSRLLARMVFPGALFCILGATDILRLWTRSDIVAADAGIVLSIVAFSFALHGVMYAPHALVLAAGNTKAILGQYAVLLPIVLPFTFWCISEYGIIGAAISQLTHFSLYLMIGSLFAHRVVLRGYLAQWLLTDIAPAAVVTACVGYIGLLVVSQIQTSPLERVAASAVIAGIAALIIMATEKRVKRSWHLSST